MKRFPRVRGYRPSGKIAPATIPWLMVGSLTGAATSVIVTQLVAALTFACAGVLGWALSDSEAHGGNAVGMLFSWLLEWGIGIIGMSMATSPGNTAESSG